MNFESFKLHPLLLAGVKDLGYETPTPIQRQAIPPAMQGRDVLGLAQTGTGKTAAFVLPILQRLMESGRGPIRALIVAPTRELAEQIHEAFKELGAKTQCRYAAIYGGISIKPQIDKLRRGVDVVVACPGRLLDHLGQGTINLSQVEVLVLDEADRMFDMGFLPDVRRIIRAVPARRQTMLFSATMPDEVRHLTGEVLKDPATVQIAHGKPASSVSHALYPVSQHLKTRLLLDLIRRTDSESIIVFTRTKHRAKRVDQQLQKAGFEATSLQGNLSQNKRQEALAGFKNGSYKIMVATDIASRGIDVTQISHVINYDMPDTVDAYTHRIGRTGRLARTGDAFTLITGEDEPMVRAIERILGEKLERRTLEDFDYKAAKPSKDTEFARPPLPPRRRPPSPQPGHRIAKAASPNTAAAQASARPDISRRAHASKSAGHKAAATPRSAAGTDRRQGSQRQSRPPSRPYSGRAPEAKPAHGASAETRRTVHQPPAAGTRPAQRRKGTAPFSQRSDVRTYRGRNNSRASNSPSGGRAAYGRRPTGAISAPEGAEAPRATGSSAATVHKPRGVLGILRKVFT